MGEWIRKRGIGDLSSEAAGRWGPREALVFEEGRWSFSDFDNEVNRVAAALIAAGLRRGEKVALWLPNRPEYLFAFFAIIRAGGVAVPLNTRYRRLDFSYALRDCDAALLITSRYAGPVNLLEMVEEAVGQVAGPEVLSADFPELRRIVFLGDDGVPESATWRPFLAAGAAILSDDIARRAAAVDPDEPAYILYTSGTTGDAKGVLLDHASIRLWTDRAGIMGLSTNDSQLNYLPLFHAYSLAYCAAQCLLSGARHVLMETFEPKAALRMIEREQITVVHGFDTHYQGFLDELKRESYDLSSLRVGTFASGMESSVAIALEVQKRICPTIACYGMTETSSGITQCALDATEDQRCRASGYPLPDIEVRVVSPETGGDVAPGEQGEILVRGYCLMSGYYKKPDETRAVLDADGWLHTGDAGILRPDGHLRFVGRYKDMLKVGGENVSPAEIEALLTTYPGVAQAAVVGRPDARLSEVPVAFIVTDPTTTVDALQLIEFCRGKLASFKVPRQIHPIDALPMTPSGKVQKVKLRETLRAMGESPASAPA